MLVELMNEKMRNEKLSYREASQLVGVSHTTLLRFSRGENIDLDTMLKICNWLNVNPADYINAEKGDDGSVAAKIALIMSQKPRLMEVFSKVIADHEKGDLTQEDVQDIISYTLFRINK